MNLIYVDWSKIPSDWYLDFTCPFCNEEEESCEKCIDGYIEPMMNYACRIDCDLTIKNRRIAAKHGLFLFEHPDEKHTYMSLMGGGMDLTPKILQTYLEITRFIPIEWAKEFQDNYWLSSKESQIEVAKACANTIQNTIENSEDKLQRIKMFIDKNETITYENLDKQFDHNQTPEKDEIDKNHLLLIWCDIFDISIALYENGTPIIFKSKKEAEKYASNELAFNWKIIEI